MKFAEYKCTKCEVEWVQTPIPQYDSDGKLMGKTFAVDCPKCQSLYVEWLNFKEFER